MRISKPDNYIAISGAKLYTGGKHGVAGKDGFPVSISLLPEIAASDHPWPRGDSGLGAAAVGARAERPRCWWSGA